MKLLILGGTQFVGYHITQTALARGHHVTLFNRGKTNSQAFAHAERLVGDRTTDLSALDHHTWDAVIDVNAYHPKFVRSMADALQGRVGHYAFISTISVHPDSQVGDAEDAPLADIPDEALEINGETYGGFKVACEQAVTHAFPNRSLIIRPGLVVGSHDHTDRFNYWIARTALGEAMLVPPAEALFQVIDARDLADFTIKQIEQGTNDLFEVTGQAEAVTMGNVLQIAKEVSKSDVQFVWATDAFLLENGVQPFADLPLWLPTSEDSFYRRSVAKAVGAGLTFRPIENTIEDLWIWWQRERLGSALRFGMSRDREKELLEKWASA